jgi:hypothetical protein
MSLHPAFTARLDALLATPAGYKALRAAVESAERVTKLSTSRGKARGRGQSSKAKGRSGVQQVAAALTEHLGIAPDEMLVKATSMGGVDLWLSPAARKKFRYAIEVKNVEALNIWAALAQAEAQANGQPAVVFFKRAKSPLYVACLASDFLKAHSNTGEFIAGI